MNFQLRITKYQLRIKNYELELVKRNFLNRKERKEITAKFAKKNKIFVLFAKNLAFFAVKLTQNP